MKKHLTPEGLALIAAKPVLTVAEAATVAGISIGTLYKRWKAGAGPDSFHVGRSRRIRRAALDAWIKQREKSEVT